MSNTLAICGLSAGYGATIAIEAIDLTVNGGTALAVLGRNGVGKTTLLATLMGLTTRHGGSIRLGDAAIEGWPTHRRARAGIAYVPQQRDIFPSLSVEENIAVSTLPGGWTIDAIFALFPGLAERRRNSGNRLSGGEQQMLAIGRALAGAPKVLLLDEPLEGLAPIVVDSLFDALAKIRDEAGLTIVLVEQKIDLALAFAPQVVVLDRGRIVHQGASAALRADEALQARTLGLNREI